SSWPSSWGGAGCATSSWPAHRYKTFSSALPLPRWRKVLMRKIAVIAAREYQAAVRTKSFVVSLLILPVMMGGGIVMQHVLRDQVDIREKRFAVVDRTEGEKLYARLAEAAQRRSEKERKEIFDATGKQVKPVFTIIHVAPSADNSQEINSQRYELSEKV